MAEDPRSPAAGSGPARPERSYVLDFRTGARSEENDQPCGSDISTLAAIGGSLFCASDETGSIERLDLDVQSGTFRDRRSFRLEDFFPKLKDKSAAGGKKQGKKKGKRSEEADIEGLAFDGDYLWVTGSHSLKRPIPDPPGSLADFAAIGWDRKRALLGRIPVQTGKNGKPALRKTAGSGRNERRAAMMAIGRGSGDDPLRKLLEKDPRLGPYVMTSPGRPGLPSKENGFDVEGLAVSKGSIVLGLRGPVLGSYAFVVVLALKENRNGELIARRVAGRKPYRLHALHLFGLGIRDLLFDGDRLLVLAGATQKTESLQRVFAIDDFFNKPEVIAQSDVQLLMTLPISSYGDHAEGIALVGDKELLVAHDSPSPARWDADQDRLVIDSFKLP